MLPFPGRAYSPRPDNGAAAVIPACLFPPPAAAGRNSSWPLTDLKIKIPIM